MSIAAAVRSSVVAVVAITVGACHHAAAPAGATSSAASPNAASAPASRLPAGVTAPMIAEGDSIFNAISCSRCHGKGAVGATNGPSLVRTKWDHGSGSYADIVKTITTGVPKEEIKDPSHTRAMPPRGGTQTPINDQQISAVGAYVWSLNHPMK